MLASRSHPIFSKTYWITTASGRQMAQLTVVIVKSMSHPTAGVATRPGYPGTWGGNRQAKLEEYCNWGLTQVKSDRWRNALQIANTVAIDQFLELNTILQHPEIVAKLMVKNGVQPGIALQIVSNIRKFLQETKKP